MYSIYSITFIILPTLSWSFTCHYNESLTISRNTILLELENRNYVQIYNASYEIQLKNKTDDFELIPGQNLRYIENILFKGYVAVDDVSSYIETTINSLVAYRYRKYGNVCQISYQEIEDKSSKLTFEQETAILRLAQSCIQSKVCDIDLMKIDRDADLYYMSIQSSINELLDFYIPKFLDSFLQNSNRFKIPSIHKTAKGISFSAKGGFVYGLDNIQRVNDVFVKLENFKYNVNFKLRFSKLNVFLKEVSAKYGKIGIYGNVKALIEGLSIRANMIVDINQQTCSIQLNHVGKFSFNHIRFRVSVYGSRYFSYNLNSKKLYKLEKDILNFVVERIPQFHVDCKEYVDKLTGILEASNFLT